MKIFLRCWPSWLASFSHHSSTFPFRRSDRGSPAVRPCPGASAAGGFPYPSCGDGRVSCYSTMHCWWSSAAVLALTFMVLLSLPQCKLRDMLMPFVAWGFVVLCAAYAISPVDILPEIALGPFGLFDDLGPWSRALATAMATIQAQRQKQSGYHDPYFN